MGLNNIVFTLSRDMGSIKARAATNTISYAIDLCSPKYVIMSGICASLKNNINICDVIIADNIIGFDSKK